MSGNYPLKGARSEAAGAENVMNQSLGGRKCPVLHESWPAPTKKWTSSTDKTASFYFGSGYGIAKKLMVTDKFVARTTPYNENPVTAIFDTRGLSKAIEPLRDACGWR